MATVAIPLRKDNTMTYEPDESEAEELRAQVRFERRQLARYIRNPDPRDPDYPGDPDHQYTGQQPLDLD